MSTRTRTRPVTPVTDALTRKLYAGSLPYEVTSHTSFLGTAASVTPPSIRIDDPWSGDPILIVDGATVPAGRFSLDAKARKLRWQVGTGAHVSSGNITFDASRAVGHGHVLYGSTNFTVEVSLKPVTYVCAASSNAGAHLSSADGSLQLHTDGVSWDDATWVPNVVEFSYSVKKGHGFGDPSRIVPGFTDPSTGVTWKPFGDITTMDAELALRFDAAGGEPPADDRTSVADPQGAFPKVFPTRMLADLSVDAMSFVGAILTDDATEPPTVYAIKGTAVQSDPLPVPAFAQMALDTDDTGSSSLDGTTLTDISVFQIVGQSNGQNQYVEYIQKETLPDFYSILKSYLPDDLLQYVSPPDPNTGKPTRPTLSPELQQIAATPGADGTSAASWYPQLGLPYLVQALSTTDDPYASKLNAVRARKWVSTQVSKSSVYNIQMPLAYSMHLEKHVPPLPDFLADQRTNATSYAAAIAAERDRWTKEVLDSLDNPDAASVKAFTDLVDTLSTKGEAGYYWAYWVYRYVTSPQALMQLRGLSMTPGPNNSTFAQHVQSMCAVLSVLEPSGTFTKAYVEAISLVQIGNILPELLDYSGDLSAYNYITEGLLKAFIAHYEDSTDPEIQKAVAALQDVIDRGQVGDIVSGFVGIAGEISGSYNWEQLAEKLAETLPKTAKVTRAVANLVTMACATAGVVLFILNVRDWSKLNEQQKATVVTGGIEIFVNIVMAVVKRGAAVGQIWSSSATRAEALKIILNPLEDSVVEAQKTVLRGTTKWILDDGTNFDVDADGWMDRLGTMFTDDATADMTAMERAFGRNLSEFAIRIGAIFAIVNLILGAIALAGATDPMSIAEDSLFVASAAIEVIAFAGGWILGAAGVEVIAGVAVATIISACTFVAGALAVVGLIILLVLLFQPQPSPVQTFAQGPAADGGYYMPFGAAIDSFQAYAQKGQPMKIGVAMSAAGDMNESIRIAADGSLSLGSIDYTGATCFYLETDEFGRARFASITDAAVSQLLCLAVNDTGAVVATPYTDTSQAGTQLWTAELQGQPTTTTITQGSGSNLKQVTQVTAGQFTIATTDTHLATSPYLAVTPTGLVLSATPTTWTIQMVSMIPAGLSVGDITLSVNDRDRVFGPRLDNPGSPPRTWTVTPPLPDFLSFDAATGVISQKLGVPPAPTEPTTYQLSCSNATGAAAPASFTLSVKPAAILVTV